VAEIRPFRGLHYNQSIITDLSEVICPPFDTITPQLLEELYSVNEHNFVRLEAARELPQDSATDNKYTRSAATLERWLEQGILEVDPAPAIYLHDHYFMHRGKEHRRRAIVARVRLEEWEKKVVRPHEGILAEARDDRLKLLGSLNANTSPVLAMYQDPDHQISSVLSEQERNEPLFGCSHSGGERHNLWAITDPSVLSQISTGLADQPIYIADGHHRYTSALTYRRERSAGSPSSSGDEAFNFVMMTLVDFADPGLVILPPHRLVRGISRPLLDGLVTRLEVFFEIEEWSLGISDVWRRIDDLLADTATTRLVFCGPSADHLSVLTLRDPSAISQIIPYFHSQLYQTLDVSIVDHVILDNLLELGSSDVSGITYSFDRQDAVEKVRSGDYQLAFLLRPVTPQLIKAVADNGDRMPGKATYFYPKAPAGLVLNRLV